MAIDPDVQVELDALSGRVSVLEADGSGDGSVSITDFGGGPDKTPAVNVAALHDALAAADGYKPVKIPRVDGSGEYWFDAPIVWREKDEAWIVGAGGSPHRPGSWLKLAGGGAFTFLDFAGNRGARFTDLSISASDAGFTGTLLDFGGTDTREAKENTLDRYLLLGGGAGAGLSLQFSHGHAFRDGHIMGLGIGILGYPPGAVFPQSASNIHQWDRVKFFRNAQASIVNPGGLWLLNSPIFQGWGDTPSPPDPGSDWSHPAVRFDGDDGDGASAFQVHNASYVDTVAGVGFEVKGQAWVFSGAFSCVPGSGENPPEHVTIKVVDRVDGLDMSGLDWFGYPPGVAVDLGNGLVSNYRPGNYGIPGDWSTHPDPERGSLIRSRN
ncbi:MAG: hypothetical protein GY767_02530 [Shimia sp.]|nr:hypothetical protein [Shimia sp.]